MGARSVTEESDMIRKYMGCNITRVDRNGAGIRWEAFTPKGRVRAAVA